MKGRRTPPATRAPETGPMRKDMMVNVDPESTARRPPLALIILLTLKVVFRLIGMVTAESLNFDVLQIIFAYLSVPDLASVSQVNRSFLAGVLPKLYRSIGFYLNQAKRYPRVGHCCSALFIAVDNFQ